MGSCSSSGKGSIFKVNNPAGIPSNHVTEDEFLALKGLGDSVSGAGIDMIGGANMHHLSDKQRKRVLSTVDAQRNQYYADRQKAREEYKQLISKGEIIQKTPLEQRITTAHGNPDLASTQAARRIVERMGYDWKTGKKLKK